MMFQLVLIEKQTKNYLRVSLKVLKLSNLLGKYDTQYTCPSGVSTVRVNDLRFNDGYGYLHLFDFLNREHKYAFIVKTSASEPRMEGVLSRHSWEYSKDENFIAVDTPTSANYIGFTNFSENDTFDYFIIIDLTENGIDNLTAKAVYELVENAIDDLASGQEVYSKVNVKVSSDEDNLIVLENGKNIGEQRRVCNNRQWRFDYARNCNKWKRLCCN